MSYKVRVEFTIKIITNNFFQNGNCYQLFETDWLLLRLNKPSPGGLLRWPKKVTKIDLVRWPNERTVIFNVYSLLNFSIITHFSVLEFSHDNSPNSVILFGIVYTYFWSYSLDRNVYSSHFWSNSIFNVNSPQTFLVITQDSALEFRHVYNPNWVIFFQSS